MKPKITRKILLMVLLHNLEEPEISNGRAREMIGDGNGKNLGVIEYRSLVERCIKLGNYLVKRNHKYVQLPRLTNSLANSKIEK